MAPAEHNEFRSGISLAESMYRSSDQSDLFTPRYSGHRLQEASLLGEESCDWWFDYDPSPLFFVDAEGRLCSANPAGKSALEDGRLLVNGAGLLKFGSADCDSSFLSAVRQVAGRAAHCRAVLRQRHGGWFGVGFHGAPNAPLVVVVLREEPTPSPLAMTAICAAFKLTSSELEVLRCLLVGECPKGAAIRLSISEHTVRAHIRSLYAKMNVRGITGLIRLSYGLI